MCLKSRSQVFNLYDTLNDTKKNIVSFHHNFILRPYVRKDGTCQIYLHINSDGSRKRIALGLYCEKKKWNYKKHRAKNIAKYQDLNLILDILESSITKIKTQFRLSNEVLTISKFVNEFNSNFSRIDFLAFFEMMLDLEKANLKKGTYRRYKAVLCKLQRYQPKILFADINFNMLVKIKSHFKTLGNKSTTIAANLSVIRKFLRMAKKNGIDFPLDLSDLKVGNQNGNRESLLPEEIKILYDYYNSGFINPNLRLVLGYFLFSCFTGLRIGDVQKINREDISDRFTILSNKTQKHLTINLTEKAKQILKTEPKLFEKHLSREYINRELKKIMVAVGIKKKVSFHIARHSFATNYIRMKGSVVYLKELMGHASIDTTMIYVNMVNGEKNKEINILDDMF